jgi:hypothetical protein
MAGTNMSNPSLGWFSWLSDIRVPSRGDNISGIPTPSSLTWFESPQRRWAERVSQAFTITAQRNPLGRQQDQQTEAGKDTCEEPLNFRRDIAFTKRADDFNVLYTNDRRILRWLVDTMRADDRDDDDRQRWLLECEGRFPLMDNETTVDVVTGLNNRKMKTEIEDIIGGKCRRRWKATDSNEVGDESLKAAYRMEYVPEFP